MTHSALLSGANILVIGASSFIGSHLTHNLLSRGVFVHGTSLNGTTGFGDEIYSLKLDITDGSAVEDLLRQLKPDYIFNLSGFVNGARSADMVWPTFNVNLEGTINLLMALQEYPCKRLVITGSMEEVQPHSKILQPVSPYAASKIAASSYAKMFQALYNTPVVIAQPFMVYGPNQKDHNKLTPYTILSLLQGKRPQFSSGKRRADWIYVEDVVEGMLLAATQPAIEGCSLQLGTGKLHSVMQVVECIFQLLGVDTPPEFGSMADRKRETEIAADVEETKNLIGWEAKVSLEDGLKRTVEWYLQQEKIIEFEVKQ